MKGLLLLYVFYLLFANVAFMYPRNDSISRQSVEVQLLQREVKNLEKNLTQFQNEREKQNQLRNEKTDSRLTYFIWAVTIVIGLLAFLGRDVLKKTLLKYFENQAGNLTDKMDTVLTEDWMKE